MMKLDEIKKFNSTVFNILEKMVDTGVDVNIDLSLPGTHPARSDEKYGEIMETNYWSTEGIVNNAYLIGKSRTPESARRNWGNRPLTGEEFDNAFTIKKVDGVLTFMAREKQDD